jgi:hypothetical protein
MNLARIAIAAALLSLGSCAVLPVGFRVEAVLRDGAAVQGRLDSKSILLTLLVDGGETVDVELRRPESWSPLTTAAEVEWLPERSVFLIRAASFTAEALEIRSPLEIRESAGRDVELPWSQIRYVRFRAR